MKKLFAVILCLCMIFTMSMGVSAYTINKDDAEIGADEIFGSTAVYFEDAEVDKGGDVTVDVMIDSNPGVTEVKINFAIDEGIAIKGVQNGDFGTATVDGNVVTVTNANRMEEDGCIVKVTFTATAEGVKEVVLTATAKDGSDEVSLNGSKCVITVNVPVITVVRGDVDGDGLVSATDLAVLKLYLVSLEDEVSEGADLDYNNAVNASDLALLKLLLAGLL